MSKVHSGSVIEREKLLNRLALCKKELKRCKQGLAFWSKELGLVVDAIADDTQFNFESILGQDGVL